MSVTADAELLADRRHGTAADGNRFPAGMEFRAVWRSYQERLLAQLDSYLAARRFHLIAAPGSGKTVLGLEIVRRIGKPTLVLAPTITIREQWVERLVECFLPAGDHRPEWVSTDLRHPQPLTITTYQALHALCAGEPPDVAEPVHAEGEGDADAEAEAGDRESDSAQLHDAPHPAGRRHAVLIPDVLARAGFRTVVVDEAHHLRAAWWKTLTAFVDHLDEPTVVALTATPPYDGGPVEWQRYSALCGPVDAEVSVPELVRHGDLCPHQDYVHLSAPSEKVEGDLASFHTSVDAFLLRLRANHDFTASVAAHPWMVDPQAHVEEILTDPPYLSAMAIYLHAAAEPVPAPALHVLGVGAGRIPDLDLAWAETLLSGFLGEDAAGAPSREALVRWLRHELFHIGALERHTVRLRDAADHLKLLSTSATKLRSIEAIVRLEAGALGDDLRCVILTDFIRKDELRKPADASPVFEDIGVVPIFDSLRCADLGGVRLGVLSGSLVVIPVAAETALRPVAVAAGIRPDDAGPARDPRPLRQPALPAGPPAPLALLPR